MNKKYFRQKAKETTPEELAAGWVYVGQMPKEYGLTNFKGYDVNERKFIFRHNHKQIDTLMGFCASHYFMAQADWESIFGPLKTNKETLEQKIARLEKELAAARKEKSEKDLPSDITALKSKSLKNKPIPSDFLNKHSSGTGYILSDTGNNFLKWKIERHDLGMLLVPDFEA